MAGTGPQPRERTDAQRLHTHLGKAIRVHTDGRAEHFDRLVLAQDTGTAIVGAVRADYYAGSGPAAGELAGRLKQPLQLWALWPR